VRISLPWVFTFFPTFFAWTALDVLADVVTLNPISDGWVGSFLVEENMNYNTATEAEILQDNRKFGVMQFSLPASLKTATISSVTLTVEPVFTSASFFYLAQPTTDWIANEVTYNNSTNAASGWDGLGGGASTAVGIDLAGGGQQMNGATTTWTSTNPSVINDWANGAAVSGLFVHRTPITNGNARYGTLKSDAGGGAAAPQLKINFFQPSGVPFWDKVAEANAAMWDDFIDTTSGTYQIYTYLNGNREPDLPSVALVQATNVGGNINATGGWGTGIEDSTLQGGIYLGAMLDRYSVTGKPEHAEEARNIYQGLRIPGTVSDNIRSGFIPRGVLPDGTTRYIQSSVDQYSAFAYGMWRYYRSPVATASEKVEIQSIFSNMLTRLEADQYAVLQENGDPLLFGDLDKLERGRAERLLAIVLAGADITGDSYWQDVYDQLLPTRIPFLHGNHASGPQYEPWVLQQNQMAFYILRNLEQDPTTLALYEHASLEITQDSLSFLTNYDETHWLERRNALEGALLIAMTEDEQLILEHKQLLEDIVLAYDQALAQRDGRPIVNLATSVEGTAWTMTAALPVGADFNENGIIDGGDFLSWQRGESPFPLSAFDLAGWESNFGTTGSGSLASSANTIPEPSAFALFAMAATVVCSAMRRNDFQPSRMI